MTIVHQALEMIISHKHKFIFLKTTKTAGTSIEIGLSKFCGPSDIITSITPEDERTRKELGYCGPQHHLSSREDYHLVDWLKLIFTGKRKRRYYHHISAREVKTLIGEETWNNYFKFCFIRNPWDRMVSQYYWRNKSGPRPSFSKFIESRDAARLMQYGFGVYTIDGKVAVDKVCRYERLTEELEELRQQFGFPEDIKIPRAKASYRKDKRHYREILSESDRQKIEELFRKEIELFGYEF